jgi:protein-S-isoprenylcysteine O-methyltransferase Ste14
MNAAGVAGTLITAMWIGWYAYWIGSAFRVKPVQRRESGLSELTHRLPIVLAVLLLLFGPRVAGGTLSVRVAPRSAPILCVAVALVAAGLGFAIWARRNLAGNWSARVTVKQEHELIQSGPYRWVRHPIYTGMLVAVMGTFITIGTRLALIAFALIAIGFVRKLTVEERFMAATFGAAYQSYRRETARLIPFVW